MAQEDSVMKVPSRHSNSYSPGIWPYTWYTFITLDNYLIVCYVTGNTCYR
jgi:hypothetical protein